MCKHTLCSPTDDAPSSGYISVKCNEQSQNVSSTVDLEGIFHLE